MGCGKESLKGKRILLWCEQGIGDTLNWASKIYHFITSQSASLYFRMSGKLVPLLNGLFLILRSNRR